MATKNIYLLDPYNDVIKVNATSDSVFRLDLNKSIIYTRQQLWDKIDAVAFLNEFEDDMSRINRFATIHQNNIADLCHAPVNIANLIQWYNSYCDNICGGISYVMWAIYQNYIGTNQKLVSGGDINGNHAWNDFNNGFVGSSDNIDKVPFYKDRYTGASFAELQLDGRFYYEPLRAIRTTWHHTKTAYVSYVTNSALYDVLANVISTIDNVYMRMPSGSSFVFPVKSSNIPKLQNGNNVDKYGNLIMTIPTGIIGNVEMPFNLLQITGAGTVTVDGVEYTLPADEAALKVVLQTTEYETEKWFNSFTINTNTGGLEAEFLLNYCKTLLLRNNVIDYTITSGSITFERAKTTIPIETNILSIDLQDSGSWTLDFCNYFTKNKSLRLPTQSVTWSNRGIYFMPNTLGKFGNRQFYNSTTDDEVTKIDAGIAVVDQCFASRLDPKDESFASTLELSFVSFDGSATYYTLDGTTPSAAKTLYTDTFTISATTTVKWINIKADYADSHVNTRVITKV